MMTVPLVLLLVGITYLAVHYGKQGLLGVVVGVALGMALMSTAIGPPLYTGMNKMVAAFFAGAAESVTK